MISLMPPASREALAHQLELPALALGEARVHPEQIGGEQRRFLAAGAGANFEDDVLLVVRIARREQDAELLLELLALRDERLQLLLRERAHVGIAAGGELLRLLLLFEERLVRAVDVDRLLDFRDRLGVRPVFGRIGLHGRIADHGDQLVVARFECLKFVEHRERAFTLRRPLPSGDRRQERDLVAVAHRRVHPRVIQVDRDRHGPAELCQRRMIAQQRPPHIFDARDVRSGCVRGASSVQSMSLAPARSRNWANRRTVTRMPAPPRRHGPRSAPFRPPDRRRRLQSRCRRLRTLPASRSARSA